MKKETKNENLDICRECGGMCCKKSGCDYSANDFKNCSYDTLAKELQKGDKSIVCYMKFKIDADGNYIYDPFLYLRARNKNRDVIDLISIKTGCALLNKDGCDHPYKQRPEGGRNLKPVRFEKGMCYPLKNPMSIVSTWKPYQKVLKRIVLTFTGMNLDAKIRQDVENLFYDILIENYEDISIIELEDIKNFAILLSKVFPTELKRANERCENKKLKVLTRQ